MSDELYRDRGSQCITRRVILNGDVSEPVVPGGWRVFVIAHRGEHLRHAENTLEAFVAAAGVGFIGVDLRTLAFGKLPSMHDAPVDPITGRRGDIAAMPFREMRRLRVGGKAQFPTFDEALALPCSKNVGV